MTQTPRDWQKDMEMCEAVTPGPWEVSEDECGDPTVINHNSLIAMELNEVEAKFIAESRTALPYWLQEVDKLQRGIKRWSKVAHETQADLDTTEAREQRLKEEIEGALRFIGRTEHIPEETVAGYIRAHFNQALSTLYPDTPAPKEG